MGQFHQRFQIRFCVRRSPKVQKDTDDLTVFYVLLESACKKALHKMLVKSTPDLTLFSLSRCPS